MPQDGIFSYVRDERSNAFIDRSKAKQCEPEMSGQGYMDKLRLMRLGFIPFRCTCPVGYGMCSRNSNCGRLDRLVSLKALCCVNHDISSVLSET